MTKRATRQILRGAAVCGALGVMAVVIGVFVVADHVFSPRRRPVQDYHYHTARLANPAAYGLAIRASVGGDGAAPFLLVEPDAATGPGDRGSTLRKQLMDNGVPLAPYGAVDGVAVLLHGRGGRKEDLLPVAERFVAAGFRCLLPDLPAHGASPLARVAYGASDFEQALPGRVLAAARRRFGLPTEPAALWGLSMGGAVAVRAASESAPGWRALVVVGTFDALEEVITAQMARYVAPLGPAMTRAIDHLGIPDGAPRLATIRPAGWAGQVTVPTLVVHGDHDRLIPLARGRRLFDALASPAKRWVVVPGGGHHGILATPAPLYAEMSAWLLRWIHAPDDGRGAPSNRAAPPRAPVLPTTGSGHAT